MLEFGVYFFPTIVSLVSVKQVGGLKYKIWSVAKCEASDFKLCTSPFARYTFEMILLFENLIKTWKKTLSPSLSEGFVACFTPWSGRLAEVLESRVRGS